MSEASSQRPLFVSHTGAPGGSNAVLISLLRHAPAGPSPACVFLEPGPAAEAVEQLGIPVAIVRSGLAREVWRAPGTIAKLRRLIRSARADLVFAHATKAHAYASLAARNERVPYLWWQHDPPHLRAASKLIAARLPANAVVCYSDFSAARQRELGSRAPVVTIRGGIEIDRLPQPHVHRSTPEAVVGSVGRLQHYKRHHLLLEAVPPVLASKSGVRFRIVGGPSPGADDGYAAELERLAEGTAMKRAVELLGHVPDAHEQLLQFDVLVHCAESEPFGLVLIEAMLAGVPVVCPPSGGPAEIVRDGLDGIHVDVEDSHALANAILMLLDDPDLRQAMGREGRKRVLDHFTADRMAQETWALMQRVARAGRPRGSRSTTSQRR